MRKSKNHKRTSAKTKSIFKKNIFDEPVRAIDYEKEWKNIYKRSTDSSEKKKKALPPAPKEKKSAEQKELEAMPKTTSRHNRRFWDYGKHEMIYLPAGESIFVRDGQAYMANTKGIERYLTSAKEPLKIEPLKDPMPIGFNIENRILHSLGIRDCAGTEIYEGDEVEYFDFDDCRTLLGTSSPKIAKKEKIKFISAKHIRDLQKNKITIIIHKIGKSKYYYRPLNGTVNWDEKLMTYSPIVNYNNKGKPNDGCAISATILHSTQADEKRGVPASYIKVVGHKYRFGGHWWKWVAAIAVGLFSMGVFAHMLKKLRLKSGKNKK